MAKLKKKTMATNVLPRLDSVELGVFFSQLPREHWAYRDSAGETLLHWACLRSDKTVLATLLRSKVLDVSARNDLEITPAHYAALGSDARALELLCAAGASMRACDALGTAPYMRALWDITSNCTEAVRVILANGLRLSTVCSDYEHYITPQMRAFERAVLCCRSAVVALIGTKRFRGQRFQHVDRFLFREIAVSVWATRYDFGWSNEKK